MEGPKTEKVWEPTVIGMSRTRNLETDSIRSRAERTGWCVRLHTVIEIRRITARNAFIAEGLLTELVYKITNVISCTALQISNVISRTALQISNVIIIIIMEICKEPTLRRKAMNKHTHIM